MRTKDRDSNLELLRILSMIAIVTHHFLFHSGAIYMDVNINKYIALLLNPGGKIGVNCFVLISGYFLCRGRFKSRKIINLIFDIFTYTLPIIIIFLISGYGNLTMNSILKSVFPITFGQYWFITAYVAMYIFSPFLNILINNLTYKKFKYLLVLLSVLLVVIPTLTDQNPFGNSIIWFVYLYFIAAFLRLYIINRQNYGKTKFYSMVSVIAWLMIFLSSVFVIFVGRFIPSLNRAIIFFHNYNNILTVIASIFIFLTFININIGCKKIINSIASVTLGIYVIHDNMFIRDVLWSKILHVSDFYYKPYFVIYMLFCVIAIFIMCGLIVYIKNVIVGNLLNSLKLFDNTFERIDNAVNLEE